MKTVTVVNHDLSFELSTDTIYINTTPRQGAQASLAVTITNTGKNPVVFKTIAILLPVTITTSPDGVTTKADPAVWNFKKSSSFTNQFDATAVAGTASLAPNASFTLELNTIKLVNTIAPSPVDVIVKTKLATEPAFDTLLPVKLLPAIAAIDDFSVSRADIKPGEATELRWRCHMIDYCIINPDIGRQVSSFSLNVSPGESTTYTIYAYGPGVLLFAQLTVTVANVRVINFGPPDAHNMVKPGDNITLGWSCNRFAKRLELKNDGGVTTPPNLLINGNTLQSGSIAVGPIKKPTTFTLFAFGDGDKNFDDHKSSIYLNDVQAQFTATPHDNLWQRDKVKLEWDISNAIAVSISPALTGGPSLTNLKGSVEIFPETDVTYKLTVKGYTGIEAQTIEIPITLTVQRVVINSFTVYPVRMFPEDDSATLSWNVNAQVRSLDHGVGAVTAVGSKYFPNAQTGVYTLTAGTNQNPNMVTKQVTVRW